MAKSRKQKSQTSIDFDEAARRRDAELLALVEAAPDEASVQVYADWLEERGDIRRATFLRMQQQVGGMKLASPKLFERGRALYDLGKTLDAVWIAAVTHPKLGGSVWDGRDDDGTLTLRFLTNGFVNYTQPSGTFENGRWEQVGITVAMETNAHYADYFGVIIGDTMRGNAHNIVAHKWRWKVMRTDNPTVVAVPDTVNRTIHDDHVRREPQPHRTPRKTPVPKTKKPRAKLVRKKPLVRRATTRTKRR